MKQRPTHHLEFNHDRLDCTRFKRDLDVLRFFSYPVQLNPLITAGKTYANMNSASQVEELSIFREVDLPLDVFCLINLQTLRVNGTPFVAHFDIDDNLVPTGLSPLISRLTRLRVLSLVNTTASYIPPQALTQLTNITFLEVENCGLREIPSTISMLTNLQQLRLPKNHLYSMPQSIGNFRILLNRREVAKTEMAELFERSSIELSGFQEK
jgi:hypothetical protein